MKNISIVTGIISTVAAVLAWFVFGLPLSIAGLVLGIVAIVYSSKAKKEGESAIAGLVLGVIGICGSAIALFVYILGVILVIMQAAAGAI